MLDLSYMIHDMIDKINTTAAEFKMITDKKDEPNLKAAQEFVGTSIGYVLCVGALAPTQRELV